MSKLVHYQGSRKENGKSIHKYDVTDTDTGEKKEYEEVRIDIPTWINKEKCWEEDNQAYFNKCKECEKEFLGHKHIRVCKQCTTK
jgi:hypothetical protein